MKEILIKKYEAVDGTQFDNQDDCLNYELIESAKVIVKHCISMENCFNCVLREEDSNVCRLENILQDWNLPVLGVVWSAKDENKR